MYPAIDEQLSAGLPSRSWSSGQVDDSAWSFKNTSNYDTLQEEGSMMNGMMTLTAPYSSHTIPAAVDLDLFRPLQVSAREDEKQSAESLICWYLFSTSWRVGTRNDKTVLQEEKQQFSIQNHPETGWLIEKHPTPFGNGVFNGCWIDPRLKTRWAGERP